MLGFTRLDEMDRVNDLATRLVKLTRDGKPTWVPATEDRGEGIFLQLDLEAVASWEQTILATALWEAHRQAHRRNFQRRFSETAKLVDPDNRLPAPRYWLLHTFAHIADPRDGDVVRLRRSQPHRTHLRLDRQARTGRPPPAC